MMVRVIAHRARLFSAPENSIAGILLAAGVGADGVEIDVRRSLGGVPMLLHDWSLRRMTGLPWPARLCPLFLLKRLRLQGTDERIPTLEEALGALAEDLIVALDLKEASAAEPTVRVVRTCGRERSTLLWSSEEKVVRYASQEAPRIETSLARGGTGDEALARHLDDAVAWGARGVSVAWAAVGAPFVAEAHERGLRVYAMNNDPLAVAAQATSGLDGLVTDHPRAMREVLQAAGC